MISIRELRIDYDNACAVRDLTLEIGRGEVFGLIGPNGAGKTSTMRALAGLLEPTYGSLEVDGIDVRDDVTVHHRIGFMPDFPPLYDDLMVWEFLDLFAASYFVSKAQRPDTVADYLERVGLTEKRNAMVAELSRGMRQRLMLAKTLLPNPDVLLLDEPASGLDPRGRIQMRDILRKFAAHGGTVLVSSHILSEMTDFCTSVGIMERGQLLVSGAIEDVSKQVAGVSLLTIEVLDDIEHCVDVLRELEYEPAAHNGTTLEVAFSGEREQASVLLAQLTRAGVGIVSFGRKKETLESIFLRAGADKLS